MIRDVSVEDWCWRPCNQDLNPERFLDRNVRLKALSALASCCLTRMYCGEWRGRSESDLAKLVRVLRRCLSVLSQSGSIRGEQGKCFPRIESALSKTTEITFE